MPLSVRRKLPTKRKAKSWERITTSKRIMVREADENEGWIEELAKELGLGKPPSVLPSCRIKRNYSCDMCDMFTQNPRTFLYHQRDSHQQKIRVFECLWCIYASKHTQKLARHIRMCHGPGRSATTVVSSQEKYDISPPVSLDAENEDIDGLGNLIGTEDLYNRNEIGHQHSDYENLGDEEQNNFNIFDPNRSFYSNVDQDELSPNLNNFTHSIFGNADDENEARSKSSNCNLPKAQPIKIFRCSICNYCTNVKARLTKHVKYHSMPVIKCEYCDFSSTYKWNLDRHYKNHYGEGERKCPICSFSCDIKQSLTVHIQNHHVSLPKSKLKEYLERFEEDNQDQDVIKNSEECTANSVVDDTDISEKQTLLQPNIYYSMMHPPSQFKPVSPRLSDHMLYCSYCSTECVGVMELNIHLISCAKFCENSNITGSVNSHPLLNILNQTRNGENFELEPTKFCMDELASGDFYRCPFRGCRFVAVQVLRFHAHMIGHHDSKPFECSECHLKFHWSWNVTNHIEMQSKYDVEHHLAQVILSYECGEDVLNKYKNNLVHLDGRRSNDIDTISTKNSCSDQSAVNFDVLEKGNAESNRFGSSKKLFSSSKLRGGDEFVASKIKEIIEDKCHFWKCRSCSFKHVNHSVVSNHIRFYHLANFDQNFEQKLGSSPFLTNQISEDKSADGGRNSFARRSNEIQQASQCSGTKPQVKLAGCEDTNNMFQGNPNFTYPTYFRNGKLNNKRYKCMECPSAFEKKASYQLHLSLHGSGQKYQCNVCTYAVTHYANYVQHLKKHHVQSGISKDLLIPRPLSSMTKVKGSSIFRCYRCSFSTKQKILLQNHIRNHYIRPQQQQKIFTKVLPKTYGMRIKKVLFCKFCVFKTRSTAALNEHVKIHFQLSGNSTAEQEAKVSLSHLINSDFHQRESENVEMLKVEKMLTNVLNSASRKSKTSDGLEGKYDSIVKVPDRKEESETTQEGHYSKDDAITKSEYRDFDIDFISECEDDDNDNTN